MHRVVSLALAVSIATVTALLVRSAGGRDDYYSGGDVSRWDHARSSGGAVVFVAGVAVAVASSLALCLGGLGWRRWNAVADVIAVAAALVALWFAWVALAGGH